MVRKTKLFHTDCSDLKSKHWQKIILYVTCTQNWEVPVSYQWCQYWNEGQSSWEQCNTVWESHLLKSYKINGTFSHKEFNADHVRLTPSKHTRSLVAEGEFLYGEIGAAGHFSAGHGRRGRLILTLKIVWAVTDIFAMDTIKHIRDGDKGAWGYGGGGRGRSSLTLHCNTVTTSMTSINFRREKNTQKTAWKKMDLIIHRVGISIHPCYKCWILLYAL